VEQNFMPSPLEGPGIDPETGAIVGTPQDTYLLHTTLAVITPETAQALQALSEEVIAQAMTSEGAIGFSFSFDPTCGFARTLGIWESEEAMLAFVVSGKHAEAMQQTEELLATGAFGHTEIAAEDVGNAWDLALAHLETVEPYDAY
jgi:quinol monooxygenase YgiN